MNPADSVIDNILPLNVTIDLEHRKHVNQLLVH